MKLFITDIQLHKIFPEVFQKFLLIINFQEWFSRSKFNSRRFLEIPGVSRSSDHPVPFESNLLSLIWYPIYCIGIHIELAQTSTKFKAIVTAIVLLKQFCFILLLLQLDLLWCQCTAKYNHSDTNLSQIFGTKQVSQFLLKVFFDSNRD